MQQSLHQNFAANLMSLCARQGSIAGVCRDLGINRQQFNKYLTGGSLPNPQTLARICAHFGIEQRHLFDIPHGFRNHQPVKPSADRDRPRELTPSLLAGLNSLAEHGRQESLREGCYLIYYPWRRDPSMCTCSAMFVKRRDGMMLFTRLTKFRALGRKQRYFVKGRHDGVILNIGRTLYLVGRNSSGLKDVNLMVFGTSNALSAEFITGLALVTDAAGQPLALRVTAVYQGNWDCLRRAIAAIGILPADSPDVPPEVRDSITRPLGSTIPALVPFGLVDAL